MSWFGKKYNKDNYISEFDAAIKAKDEKKQREILDSARENETITSQILLELTVTMAINDVKYYEFQKAYLSEVNFPAHFGHVQVARLDASMGRYGEASDRARYFLKTIKEKGDFQELGQQTYMPYFVGLAYHILTTAFTAVGAISYSQRVLKFALSLPIAQLSRTDIENELKHLDSELSMPGAREVDHKWERFFSTGENAKELYALCVEAGLQTIADRVSVLETGFRYESGYRLDEQEVLKSVVLVKLPDNKEALTML